MNAQERIEREAAFVRLSQTKTRPAEQAARMGESLVQFYKEQVQRTRKFAGIGEVWETLLPADLLEHCCLDAFRAGTLTVLVDSSPHLYQLKQLLLEGLQKQLLTVCKTQGLRKIQLRPGRWYDADRDDHRRIMFKE